MSFTTLKAHQSDYDVEVSDDEKKENQKGRREVYEGKFR